MRTAKRSRRSARQPSASAALTAAAIVLGGAAIAAAIFTTFTVSNPEVVADLFSREPSPTLYVINPTATPDRRGTLPPSWTPTRTSRPPATSTPTAIPTITATPTATTTRIPTLTFTPVNTVPAGWYEFVVRDAKLALHLPTTWTGIVLLKQHPQGALEDIAERDPILGASLFHGVRQTVVDNLILVAFDTATSGDPFVVNLNIAYANPEEGSTIDEIRDLHVQRYRDDRTVRFMAQDSTSIDGQPAHRIRTRTTFETDSGSTTVYHLEVISEGRRARDPLLIMTLSTSQERRNIYEALLDRIVLTIRFTR